MRRQAQFFSPRFHEKEMFFKRVGVGTVVSEGNVVYSYIAAVRNRKSAVGNFRLIV